MNISEWLERTQKEAEVPFRGQTIVFSDGEAKFELYSFFFREINVLNCNFEFHLQFVLSQEKNIQLMEFFSSTSEENTTRNTTLEYQKCYAVVT